MHISISSLTEGLQQQQLLAIGASVLTRTNEQANNHQAVLSQAPDSYASDTVRELVAGYAPSSSGGVSGSQSAGVNVGAVRAGSIQQLAHTILHRLLHLTVGNGAVSGTNSATSGTSAIPDPNAPGANSAQPAGSQEVATDTSTAGSLTMKGSITADNGSVYDFSLAVQVGKETSSDTQLTTDGTGSSLASVATSVLVMQSQISLSYAGTVQGTNLSSSQAGNNNQVGAVLDSLQGVAAAFASSVLGGPQSSDGANGGAASQATTPGDATSTTQTGIDQQSAVPFSGTFSLNPHGARRNGIEALFGDLYKLLNAQHGSGDAQRSSVTAGRSVDLHG